MLNHDNPKTAIIVRTRHRVHSFIAVLGGSSDVDDDSSSMDSLQSDTSRCVARLSRFLLAEDDVQRSPATIFSGRRNIDIRFQPSPSFDRRFVVWEIHDLEIDCVDGRPRGGTALCIDHR